MVNLEKKLRKENNALDKKLTQENNKILTDIIVYLHSANLCEYDIEITRKDLIGMALEAQQRQQSFKTVIGEDFKIFCDELIENGRQKTTYEKVLEAIYSVVLGVGIIFLYEVFSYILATSLKKQPISNIISMPISWGFVISTIAAVFVAYCIFYFVTKKAFDLTENSKYKALFIVVFAVSFMVILFSRILLKSYIVFTVNVIYPSAFVIIAFVIIKYLTDIHSNKLASKHM